RIRAILSPEVDKTDLSSEGLEVVLGDGRLAAENEATNLASVSRAANFGSAMAALTRLSAAASLTISAKDCQRPRPTFDAFPIA
ncbi:hypothetical protein, partial [Acinetobacter baumannii]|uniref:hypothetical protein n=1 Tax=Acinetobacter baumannii TaxID=470 RepID=UPI001BB46EF2